MNKKWWWIIAIAIAVIVLITVFILIFRAGPGGPGFGPGSERPGSRGEESGGESEGFSVYCAGKWAWCELVCVLESGEAYLACIDNCLPEECKEEAQQ